MTLNFFVEIGFSRLYTKRFLTDTNQNANHFLKSIAYDVRVKGKW